MEKDGFDFFRDHSPRFLKMALSPGNREIPSAPDGYGEKRRGGCGDTVAFYLTVRDGSFAAVSFSVSGCIYSHACANAVAHMAEGKPVEAGWDITPEAIIGYLESLPENEAHCADLAAEAFHAALTDCIVLGRSPWKKHYMRRQK